MTMKLSLPTWAAVLSLTLVGGRQAEAGPVLDRVEAARTLTCGILTQPEDWGKDDVHAGLPDLGRDMCRAVAAAVLGSADRVTLVGVPAQQPGFQALKEGRIDLLMGASPSPAAAVAFGVAFTRPVFLDGDALLVHHASGIASFKDLAGRLVCYVPDTESAAVLAAEGERRHVAYQPWPFEENGEMLAAVAGRQCDALFGSASRLALARTGFHALTRDFDLLSERYSVLPLSPAVASGDAAWAEVVDAVSVAPLLAETAGIGQADAARLADSADPLLRGLGGLLTGVDEAKVDRGWGARVVGTLGNYAEIYERDLGDGSALKIPRGANALWTRGGLMVADPIR